MPYRKIELPQHSRPLVYEDPALSYLQRCEPGWQKKSQDPEKWLEIKQNYCFFVNPLDPKSCRSCHICELEFDTDGWFMLHLNTYEHHVRRCKKNRLPPPKNPLYCCHCDFLAQSNTRFRRHCRQYEHVCAVARSKGEPLPTNEKYCKICEREFTSIDALRQHFGTKTHKNKVLLKKNETCYKCEKCKLFFASEQVLTTHYTSKKHKINCGEIDKIQTFCQFCNKECLTRKKFMRHCKGDKHKLRENSLKIKVI